MYGLFVRKLNTNKVDTTDSRLSDARTPLAHNHNYAGSTSAGGAAISANKLDTNAGSTDTPVYFLNGIPVACSHRLLKIQAVQNEFTCSANVERVITPSVAGFSLDASRIVACAPFIVTPYGDGCAWVALKADSNQNFKVFSTKTQSVYIRILYFYR